MPRASGARIASSPVFAARLALQTPTVALTQPRRVVLLDAAALWCRDLVFPTARILAEAADRAPSTILNGFETMPRIHAEIIRNEWEALRFCCSSSDPLDWVPNLVGHVQTLAELDRSLLRLPSLVRSAVVAVTPRQPPRRVSALSVAVNVIAALGEPSVELPERTELEGMIIGVLSAISVTGKHGSTDAEGRAA